MKIRVDLIVDGQRYGTQMFEPEQHSDTSRIISRTEYVGQGPGMSRNSQVPTLIETVVTVYDRKEDPE